MLKQSSTQSLLCPACGRATVHKYLYTKNGCDILRCDACGLGRAEAKVFDPTAYYTTGYFSGKLPDGYADYLGAEQVLRREFARIVALNQLLIDRNSEIGALQKERAARKEESSAVRRELGDREVYIAALDCSLSVYTAEIGTLRAAHGAREATALL